MKRCFHKKKFQQCKLVEHKGKQVVRNVHIAYCEALSCKNQTIESSFIFHKPHVFHYYQFNNFHVFAMSCTIELAHNIIETIKVAYIETCNQIVFKCFHL